MWQRILWATDFSAPARDAGRTALTLANWAGAAIEVVTVIPPDPGDLPPALVSVLGQDGLQDAERELEAEVVAGVREQLADEAGFLLAAGLDVPLHVREGDPPKEIVALAGELRIDLIVMGATGHRSVKEVIFGSTVDSVARHAPCPVLVVR